MAQDPTLRGILPPKDGVDALRIEIAALRREVASLRTAQSGNSMTIDGAPGITVQNGGGITVLDGGALQMRTAAGTRVVYAGNRSIPDGSGRNQQVLLVSRDDGTVALGLGDFGTISGHPHQQDLFWYDRVGNIVFADDAVSGVGIANPHLSMGVLQNTNVATWPATSSAAFTGIASCYVERQNARLSWTIALVAGAGITGQFRLMCAGTQVDSTQTVSGTTLYWSADAVWPAGIDIFADVYLELQARVTSGSGSVAAQCIRLRGNQS